MMLPSFRLAALRVALESILYSEFITKQRPISELLCANQRVRTNNLSTATTDRIFILKSNV